MRHIIFFACICMLIGNMLKVFPEGFVADTLVHNFGTHPPSIKHLCNNITTGKKQFVSSWHQQNKKWHSQRVRRAGRGTINATITLMFDEDPEHNITCSPIQLFYLKKQKQWIEACKLTPGDVLVTESDGVVRLQMLSLCKQEAIVYALRVKQNHTFCVGHYRLLTHNKHIPLIPVDIFARIGMAFGSGAVAGGAAGSFLGPLTCAGGFTIGGVAGIVATCAAVGSGLYQYRMKIGMHEIEKNLFSAQAEDMVQVYMQLPSQDTARIVVPMSSQNICEHQVFFDALSAQVLVDRAAQYELEYNQQVVAAQQEAKGAKIQEEQRITAELNERIQAHIPKDYTEFSEHAHGFMTRITDVKGMARDLTHFAVEVTDLCVDTLMHLILHSKQRADNPLAQATVHKSAKIFKLLDALSVKNMEQFCRNLDALTPQQRAHLLGTIMADTVTLMGIARIPGTVGKVFNGVSNLQSEGVIGRSLQQATKSVGQKVERLWVLVDELGLTHTPETIATTAEGLEVPVTTAVEETMSLRNAAQKVGGTTKEATKDSVEWFAHRHKHKPPKDMPWKDIVKSTRHGNAFYKPGINIKELELHAWKVGQKTTNGKNWKVFKADEIIGAKLGQETCCMRVECSANTIHGHPIPLEEYLELLK